MMRVPWYAGYIQQWAILTTEWKDKKSAISRAKIDNYQDVRIT